MKNETRVTHPPAEGTPLPEMKQPVDRFILRECGAGIIYATTKQLQQGQSDITFCHATGRGECKLLELKKQYPHASVVMGSCIYPS